MKSVLNTRWLAGFALVILTAFALAACQAGEPAAGENVAHAAQGEPTVTYTLTTGMDGGKLVFIGQGGEIDGAINPDLAAAPGDIVQITLVNGDGAEHDVALPDFSVDSDSVFKKGDETVITFAVDRDGEYTYYCTIPGHRQAGMEGRLIVGAAAQPDAAGESAAPAAASVVRPASDLPAPIGDRAPEQVRVDIEAVELEGQLAGGASYNYWTFNGQVPGPFIRVRAGDTVEINFSNRADSTMTHSIDLHAVTGPGGGAAVTQAAPGEEKSFTFQALNPGLYVYHCATPMVAHHITNGMYGLILVEPEGGLEPVDREFYVMQGELYTSQDYGSRGYQEFDADKLLDEDPEYFVFNGAVGALTEQEPLKAEVGETVRIYFGVGGPNFTSSFHVIGEIFDRVYDQASLTSAPLTDVQTTLVPPGGAAVVEFELEVPGRFVLVDHALSRAERGLAGYLEVEGPENPDIFHSVEPASEAH